jgi:hypothetical protein
MFFFLASFSIGLGVHEWLGWQHHGTWLFTFSSAPDYGQIIDDAFGPAVFLDSRGATTLF